MAANELLSFENPVFTSYAFYSSLLLLKFFFVIPFLVFYRIKNQVFPSEEDYKNDPKGEKNVMERSHPDIERVKRITQNDLENIPIFILLGLLYVLTAPAYSTAIIVFRIFGAARLIHTVVYFFAVRQPARGLPYLAGLSCSIFMAVQVIQATKFRY